MQQKLQVQMLLCECCERSGWFDGKLVLGSSHLETMDLDAVLLDDLVAHQESLDVLTVVTLKLNHLAQLLVVHDGTVAAELLR